MFDRAGGRPLRPAPTTHALTAALGLLALAVAGILTTPAPARADGVDRVERRVVALVNANRAAAGLPGLRLSRRLARSADAHSRDMARRGFFSHGSSDGRSFASRVRRYAAARRYGENLAYVPRSARGGLAERVVAMWMNSPPHRAEILTPGFRRVGVARRGGRIAGIRAILFTADFASGG
jgi:uncharacterized protein YkwD